jgi:hypothetical protein
MPNFMPPRLKLYLKKPYPHLLCQENGWHYLLISVGIFAVLINLFMWLSLSTWNEHHKWMILPGFGMSYASSYYIVSVSMRSFISDYSKPEAWTLGKEGVLLLLFMLLMLPVSWIYTRVAVPLEDLKQFDIYYFLKFNFINSGIMMASLLAFTGMKFKTPTSGHTKSNVQKSGENSLCVTKSGIFELKKNKYKSDEFLFAESLKNNLIMHLLVKQEQVKITEVYPLHQFEQLVSEFPQMKRCHLSYVVNLDKVLTAENSDHQLFLTLTGINKQVRVSHYYSKEITELLMLRSVYIKKQ